MSTDDLMRVLGEAYEEMMSTRDNRDYKVNEPEMHKLFNAAEFFCELACKCDGKVETAEFEPKRAIGSIYAKFQLFHIEGDDIKRLCDVIGGIGHVSIYDHVDGVCIGVTASDAFISIDDEAF